MIRQALHRCHAFVSSRRNLFTFLASETLARIFVCTLYGVLAVMASMYVGEAAAGVFLGIMGGIQLFVDYAAGYLSDKYGSKIPLLIYNSAFVVSGVLLALSIDAFWAVVAIGIISHIGWGMRIVQTYILRTIDAHEGGLLFGISDQLFGVSYFISSFLIPWCIVAQWYQELGVILIVIGCLNFIVTSSLPSDVEFLISEDKKPKVSLWKQGIHFIRTNHYYPLLLVGSALFEGYFFGAIWFILPLSFIHQSTSWFTGMTLGIYELMTIFCAALMGYIADKYDWKFLHILGWILAICGVVVMSLFPTVLMLILSGAIVGIGNNMFSESAHHALEKYDIDHAEDGAFMALSAIARESGYMVSPIVCGILYGTYGFQAALLFCATCVVLIGCLMIWQTLKLKR